MYLENLKLDVVEFLEMSNSKYTVLNKKIDGKVYFFEYLLVTNLS